MASPTREDAQLLIQLAQWGTSLGVWDAMPELFAEEFDTDAADANDDDAVRTMLVIALVSVAVYSLMPLILTGVLGTARIQADPAIALKYLSLGALFVAVGIDTTLLIRAAKELRARFS